MASHHSLTATISADHLLFAVDIAGTLMFALEGAMAAVNGSLDLIGIMTLAFCTALGGGVRTVRSSAVRGKGDEADDVRKSNTVRAGAEVR